MTKDLLTELVDADRRWNDYFEGLLNTPEEDPDAGISEEEEEENQIVDESITAEEVLMALKHMRNNKAAGIDEIPAEIYKYGRQHTIDYLTWICIIA